MKTFNNYTKVLKKIDKLCDECQFEEALSILDAYLSRHPDEPEGLYLHARCLFEQGDVEEAIKVAEKVIIIYPLHLSAYNIISAGYLEIGQPLNAIKILREIIYLIEERKEISFKDEISMREWNYSQFLYWEALMEVHEYQLALTVVNNFLSTQSDTAPNDKLRWQGYLLDTLVSLKNYSKAEIVYGADPDSRRNALLDIGYYLSSTADYLNAKVYFLRNLAYSKLPKDFYALKPYLECLAICSEFDELYSLCNYWLEKYKNKNSKDNKLLLLLLGYSHSHLVIKSKEESNKIFDHSSVNIKINDIAQLIDSEFESLRRLLINYLELVY